MLGQKEGMRWVCIQGHRTHRAAREGIGKEVPLNRALWARHLRDRVMRGSQPRTLLAVGTA